MELPKSYEDFMVEKMKTDESLMMLTAENRALLRGMPPKVGARFMDFGITEQCMIGAAAGMALRGRKPVCHALTNFLLLRAFEFIRTDVGIGKLPVKLVGWIPGVLSDGNGPTHQALEDVALMRGIPGMNVFCPADEEDLFIGLEKIIDSNEPYYIRYNPRKPVYNHQRHFEIGKAETVNDGKDLTLLVYGNLFKEAYESLETLKSQGLSVRLVNMRTIKPLDEAVIVKAAKETKMLVTIEDHFLSGGLYTATCETLVKHQTMAQVFPIAFENRWFKTGTLPRVLEHEGLTGPQLATRILNRWKEAKHG